MNFFCWLDSLVHVAEASNKALIIFWDEIPWPDEISMSITEALKTKLVRTASKAFAAVGCYTTSSLFVKSNLKDHGFKSVPLKLIRGYFVHE